MEDLEEIMDKIEECKVSFDRKKILHYLTEDLGELSKYEKTGEEYKIISDAIRDVLINTYANCLRWYFMYDQRMEMNIAKDKQNLTIRRIK